MDQNLIITLTVLVGLMFGLMQERIGAEIVMLCALLALVATGVMSMPDALQGFGNSAIHTIAALLVMGAALQTTGAMEYLSRFLLGRSQGKKSLLRLLVPVAGLSAFMNNTPLVACFLPIFVHIAKRTRTSPSQLLIPLSYAAILGGTCTLIGTSTNMVIDGALRQDGLPGLGMFEITWVGLPITIAGLLFMMFAGPKLLPNRTDLLEYVESHPREYTLEMVVRGNCELVGRTIRVAGLRDLPGLYLYAIDRSGESISPVEPNEIIAVGDHLCFSGIVSMVVDLQKIRGLEPVPHHAAPSVNASLDSLEGLPSVEPQRHSRQLSEVVISPTSPLIQLSIRDADFRTRYDASILAVHRSGEKLQEKIGQVILQAGDTLLVEAGDDFPRRWRNSRDFILVSGIEDSTPVVHEKAGLALFIFGGIVVGMTLIENVALVTMFGAVLMIVTGCVRAREAYRSIDLSILVLVAAALGVGDALDNSGAAKLLADGILSVSVPYGKIAVLAAIVLLTGVLTELLSNNACAALMAPIAFAAAKSTGIDPRPLLIAVAVTSSYGFATPIGYQTNLMVLNPGGYKFRDYLRIGIPLDIICWTLTIVLIATLWTL